jgi:hypothetical protein
MKLFASLTELFIMSLSNFDSLQMMRITRLCATYSHTRFLTKHSDSKKTLCINYFSPLVSRLKQRVDDLKVDGVVDLTK